VSTALSFLLLFEPQTLPDFVYCELLSITEQRVVTKYPDWQSLTS